MKFWKKVSSSLALALLFVGGSTAVVTALQSSSAHYGVDQTQFGSGSLLCDPSAPTSANSPHSASYCASQTTGELGVGNTASQSFQAQAGGIDTDRENSLELIVNTASVDVGVLTDSTTKVAAATFSVKSYLADGYAVYTDSPGPQNGGHTLQPLASPTASAAGTEQFGINLVADSCPAAAPALPALGGCTTSFGHDPVEVPDTTFAFGHAQSGYDAADQYKYVNGGKIAYSDTSSGETDYTMSYIFNISAVTPGGTYTMNQSIVATSTF